MTRYPEELVRERLRAMKVAVEDLERLLLRGQKEEEDPYMRRQEILERIYLAEGMEKEQLLRALREHGAQYQWIGMQVKKEYLSVIPLPGGRTRYTVTPKAVRELRLGAGVPEGELGALAQLSEAAFAEDWESPEDAIYDRL